MFIMGNVIVSRTQSRVGHFIFEKKRGFIFLPRKRKIYSFFEEDEINVPLTLGDFRDKGS